jgi:hypothetical protein
MQLMCALTDGGETELGGRAGRVPMRGRFNPLFISDYHGLLNSS